MSPLPTISTMPTTVPALLLLLLLLLVLPTSDGVKDYCQWQTFSAQCPPNHVVLMTTALYGRMRFGGCIHEDHGHTGCSADVLSVLDRSCSGRTQCSLQIPDATLHKINACPMELISYLEASYSCVEVETRNQAQCEGAQLITRVSGYLLGSPSSSALGSARCPWMFRLVSGKKLNVTLLNFASGVTTEVARASACQTLLTISAEGRVRNVSACLGEPRQRLVFSAHASTVTLALPLTSGVRRNKFMLKFAVFGCADIRPAANMQVEIAGDSAVLRCNNSNQSWFLRCEGSRWAGPKGNCSEAAQMKSRPGPIGLSRFPYGILVVIGIGVALGVAVGIVLLMSILLCLKRRREKKQQGNLTRDPLLNGHPHETDENQANCTCEASKIYVSASCDNSVYSKNQVLPDMILMERGKKIERISEYESAPPAGHVQTSFITFKPGHGAQSRCPECSDVVEAECDCQQQARVYGPVAPKLVQAPSTPPPSSVRIAVPYVQQQEGTSTSCQQLVTPSYQQGTPSSCQQVLPPYQSLSSSSPSDCLVKQNGSARLNSPAPNPHWPTSCDQAD